MVNFQIKHPTCIYSSTILKYDCCFFYIRMVSTAKFKTTILDFKKFFDYLNGFRQLMNLDFLYDFTIDDNIITFQFVRGDKVIETPLSLANMKQSYEEWLNDKTTNARRVYGKI